MAKYLLAFRGGSMPEGEEAGAKVMQAWEAWFTSVGAAVADPGNPSSVSRTIAADGSAALRFDDFSVRNGPDLFVFLSPDPAGYVEGAIELGRLRATDGSFNTPIPPGTDVAGTRSVVIWCREFAVLFAVAPLEG